jgi:hypothetical protein
MNQYTTAELLAELKRREENPTWFIRDLVAEGYDLDNDAFRDATAWMDEPQRGEE